MANHNKRNKKLQQGEGSVPPPPVGGNPPQPSARSRGIARRQFLTSALASLGAAVFAGASLESAQSAQALSTGSPPLPPTPGPARPWQPLVSLGIGQSNLASGNAHGTFPLFGWSGRGGGLNFALFYNSQSARTSPLGPKWSHSYRSYLLNVPNTQNVVWVQENGSETLFTWNGSAYVPPAGCYDSLSLNPDGSWTIVRKGGTKYFFSSTGWLTQITDRNSNTTTFSYNSANLLTSVTDAAGRSLSLSYDGSGRLTSAADCAGRTWSFQYDASNRLDTVVWPSLNGNLYAELFGYDASNNLTAYTDRLNRSWNYTYGSNGIVTGEVNPAGSKSGSGSYRAIAVQSQTSTQVISSSSSWPSGTTVVASWTDANQNTVQYGMDSQGQLLGVVDALGHQTSFSYDSAHNLLSTTTPSGSVWQQQYDNRGNMLVSQDPLGQSTQLAYGVFDLPVSVTDPLGNKTLFSLDSSTGNVLQVTDANNNVSRFSYNGDGSVASATDPAGRTTQFGYDQWGHLTSRTDPLGNVTRYSYSVDSLLQQRVDALGYVTQYSYDGWGRLVSVSYPTSGAPGISYSWDAEGQLIQSSDSTGVRSYTYDVLGRKVKAVDPRGTTQASYDAVGNLLSQTDVTGRVLTNSYDAAYRLTSVVDGSDNAQVSLSYTADGQVSSVMYPNGVEVQYSYDAAGRVTSVQHVLVSSGTVLVGYSASYDAAGRLVQVVEQPSGDVTVYQHDAVGNLLKEQRSGSRSYSGSYTYDPSNLRLSAQVVVNGVPVHMGSYSYDGGGRLVQVVDSATNTTEVYSWNATGTLASAPGPGYTRGFMWNEEGQLVGIAHNGVLAYQYGYGADGNRRWRKDLANNVWVWYPCGVACSAGELVEEVSDLSGGVWSVQALYLRVGGGCSSQLVRRNGEYHHGDVLGNYGVITDGSGNVLSSNLYDRFGVSMYTSGSAQSPYRPAAGMLDEEGLVTSLGGQTYVMPQRMLPLSIHWKEVAECVANKPLCMFLCWIIGGHNPDTCVRRCCPGLLPPSKPPQPTPEPPGNPPSQPPSKPPQPTPGPPGNPPSQPPSQPPNPNPPSGGGNNGSGGSGGCPSGTCAFKCPGATSSGCATSGSTVTCPDGTKITVVCS